MVSGGYGREQVHFVAPRADRLSDELEKFLSWFNTSPNEQDDIDLVIKAGIAHLWFVTLHPFDDGNGQLTRAITNWLAWFLQTLEQALIAAQTTTNKIINKANFWQTHRQHALNDRQVTVLSTLLTSFYGKLTTKNGQL